MEGRTLARFLENISGQEERNVLRRKRACVRACLRRLLDLKKQFAAVKSGCRIYEAEGVGRGESSFTERA